MTLGMRIKNKRIEKGLTQDDIAKHLGMGRSNVGHIENGRTMPSAEVLAKIAAFLGTTANELLGDTNSTYTSRESAQTYALSAKDERDIARELERMMASLNSDQALAFDGEPLTEEDRELLKASLEHSLRTARMVAKQKFTPKKYRK